MSYQETIAVCSVTDTAQTVAFINVNLAMNKVCWAKMFK